MEQYRVNKVWVDDAHIWLEIDENLCFEGLFADAGFCFQNGTEDEVYYQA